MAVLKNTVQVNNGNTGWNAGHVMDAMEEIFGDLGWNSGTQKSGVPQSVRSPNNAVVNPNSNYFLGVNSGFNQASPPVPTRSKRAVYYDIHANGTNDAYRLAKKFYISSSDLDVTADTAYEYDHQLSTGDVVIYGYGTEDTINKIPELTYGTTYYVIKVDNNHFKFAASSSDATGGVAIDITAPSGTGGIAVRRDPSTITDNNDINVLQGDNIIWNNYTPGVPTSFNSSVINPGTGYAATGTDVATTGGSGTGLTVDFTAFDGIIETVSINTAGTGYQLYDRITVTTGNADAVFEIAGISGSIGQQFTICLDVDDYDANQLLNDDNYNEYSNGSYEDYPRDFSNNILNPPTLSNNGLKMDTAYLRQTETQKSWCPPELRFPDFNATDYVENSFQKYIYASNTTAGMTGEIIIHASTFAGSTGNRYNYWDYTVPASGGRGALDLRIVRGVSTSPWGGAGELYGVYILNVAEGWTTGEVFTVPGDQIGGSTPTHDLTFGTRTPETGSGTDDGILEVVTTNLGAGTNFFQHSDNGLFGTLKLENDSTKKYGTTYYTFGIHNNSQPYQMWISSGSFMHWLNRYGTTMTSTNGDDYGYHSGRMGLDYQSGLSTPNNDDNYWTYFSFATSATPTAYPLKIYSYNAQSPQDDNFAIIQFVQTINEVDVQYATFYLHKGNQIGTNIYDLDHVWQGCVGTWGSSNRTLYHYTNIPGYTYYNSNASDEPADSRSLAREAFYGYYRDASDQYIESFSDQYACNIDTNNAHGDDAVTYFRDATYDQYGGYSVASQADYYRPMKGIPLSRKMMPVPYTLPDDFVLLQVSTSPGLTNFRPGDTITISASEVYEVVRAAWQTNQNSLDNLNNTSSMGILLLARTT